MKLGDLFEVKNGMAVSNLDVLNEASEATIPFLRPASTQQRTLAGFVKKAGIEKGNIFPAESLFVSTNGEGSHTYAYVSNFEFAANSDVSILIPKVEMSLQEKLFYARSIMLNRWKFSYGRKPKGNRLKSIDLPSVLPKWVGGLDVDESIKSLCSKLPILEAPQKQKKSILNTPSLTSVETLFEVIYGTNLELVSLERDLNGVNFVSRTSKNNGVSGKVKIIDSIKPIEGGVLTVAGGGSVLETFLQKEAFYSGRDLFYLKPRQSMTDEELLFYCACIRANKFRYSYGRQANRTLKDLLIPDLSSIPVWVYGSKIEVAKKCKNLISTPQNLAS